jgi:hypothetical protein
MNKKVFTYFDGQMTEEEKRLFENELASSPELRKELDDLKLVSSRVNKNNVHPEMKDYFVNVRARAAMSGNTKRSAHRWQYVFQTLAASVVVLAIYIGVSRVNFYHASHAFPEVTSSTAQEYSEAMQTASPEQNEAESMIPANADGDSFIADVISDDLHLDHKTVSTVVEDLNISTDDMVNDLSAQDAENLLASLDKETLKQESK